MPETIEIIGSTNLVTFSLRAKYTIIEQIITNNVPVLGIEREKEKKTNQNRTNCLVLFARCVFSY